MKLFPVSNPERIIVRCPNWMGDVVMATPVFRALRDHYGQARITAFCEGKVGHLLERDPCIDELITLPKPKGSRQRHEQYRLLRSTSYDLSIILAHSFRSAWTLFRGRCRNRIGYGTDGRFLLLNKPVRLPRKYRQKHLVYTFLDMLRPLGITVASPRVQLFVTGEELERGRRYLSHLEITAKDKIIGVNPGATYGEAKRWLPERFKELVRRFSKGRGWKVLLFGGAEESALAEEICSGLGRGVVNLTGKTTLREAMSLVKVCSCFVTNDSGLMHVASALEVPMVAIFGSTSEVWTGPFNGGTVIHKPLACSPCYKRVCPRDFRCMRDISVDEVEEAVYAELLQARSSA